MELRAESMESSKAAKSREQADCELRNSDCGFREQQRGKG